MTMSVIPTEANAKWRNLFEVLWRTSIIVLPWQTRWFLDASINGLAWEQGRISIYASWFILLTTIVVGFLLPSKEIQKEKRSRTAWIFGLILFAITIIATRLDQQALTAVLQWWAQIVLLGTFVVTVKRQQIVWKSLATWIVVSLIPFVVLGFVQYAAQEVWGSTWFGIAAQLSQNSGVSVVEHGVYRVLRIYGGFSHPNIFGGWLAVGVLTSLLLSLKVESKRAATLCALASSLFSVALLLTYARSAWLALVVAGIALLVYVLRMHHRNQFFWLALIASFLSVAIVGFSQRDHILARSDTSSRLEAYSVNERLRTQHEGLLLISKHPLIGTGPNVELLFMAPPLEPPHNIFLLAFANLGSLGFLVLIAMVALLKKGRRLTVFPALVYIAPLIVVGLFDHYLWSYWSGHSLVALAILLSTTQDSRA